MADSSVPETADLSRTSTDQFSQSSQAFPPISPELQTVLQHIVDDVVANLGCVGAIVATLEPDNSLPVRAYSVGFASSLLNQLEDQVGGISLVGPEAVAYLDDPKFKDNLSVRAIQSEQGRPEIIISNKLYDLFRPVVNKSLSDLVQRLIGINQVAAVPFFIRDEVVGNLFAATRDEFSIRDIKFLTAFGNQAASALQSQRRLLKIQALERIILALQTNIADETQILQTVVDAVVQKLGYVGAMVAPLEADNTLPVRAYSVDFASDLLQHLEKRMGVGLIGPQSVSYLDDERFKDNLSVRAIKGTNGKPEILVSDSLYDLFRPVVDKPLSDLAQQLTGIKQVIAVPFFLEDEVLGNLFVASRKPSFSDREKEVLITLGQQAAVGIRNARLYRRAEEQRQISQMFGRMAFSATAYIHSLRNHIGVSLNYLQLIEMMSQFPPEQHPKLLQSAPKVIEHLNEAVDILDTLHEPWRHLSDVPTDVNDCLVLALGKVLPDTRHSAEQADTATPSGLVVHKSLSEDLPLLKTSPDMLTEAFRVLIKNAVEAIEERGNQGELWIESRLDDKATIEVSIRDNGLGIKPEHLNRIFDLGWSAKEGEGMGFGLFWTKDYIEGLKGSIRVESVWQEGTTFYIHLPVPQKQDND